MNFAKSLVSCCRVQTGSYVSQPDGYLVYLAEAAGRERIPPNLKQIRALTFGYFWLPHRRSLSSLPPCTSPAARMRLAPMGPLLFFGRGRRPRVVTTNFGPGKKIAIKNAPLWSTKTHNKKTNAAFSLCSKKRGEEKEGQSRDGPLLECRRPAPPLGAPHESNSQSYSYSTNTQCHVFR